MDESSNFQEGANLVIKVIRMIMTGQIKKGSDVFIFTGYAMIERTYTKGSSRSHKLHDLIVELQKLKMEGILIIHFILITGTQIIYQQTDTFSREKVSTSSMAVKKSWRSLMLNQTAFDL